MGAQNPFSPQAAQPSPVSLTPGSALYGPSAGHDAAHSPPPGHALSQTAGAALAPPAWSGAYSGRQTKCWWPRGETPRRRIASRHQSTQAPSGERILSSVAQP